MFILGLHRSGTTLLYEMLAASGCFNIVTARHVIHFDRLQNGRADRDASRRELAAWFEREGLTTREVDVVRLGPDTPEEYGFVLDRMGAGVRITARHFHRFRRMCEVLQRDHGTDRPLLLKNPWDFGNGLLIRRLMPDAKIVYIHRNPFHVLASALRLSVKAARRPHPYLAALSDTYAALTESGFPWRVVQRVAREDSVLLARLVIGQSAAMARAYLRSIRHVDHGPCFELRYEDLCDRPEETITAILSYLDVSAQRSVDYAGMIHRGVPRVPPVIMRHRQRIVRAFFRYGERVGYDLPRLASELEETGTLR